MSERQRGLGRGLSALLGEAAVEVAVATREAEAETVAAVAAAATRGPGAVNEAPIELLERNPDQPRRLFVEADIDELAASIREKGVLQPILVRPQGEGYQIVAGERRWRAAQKAGLKAVPILVRELDDLEVLEIGIVENVQRSDLNAIEEASAYRALMERFGRTQDAVAQVVGKSRSHVANTLRLLALPEAVRDHVLMGRLSAGHARAIAGASDPEALAEKVLQGGLSVRQAEALARDAATGKSAPRPRGPSAADADSQALAIDLAEALGLEVKLDDRNGRGELKVRYETFEQLDDLCRRLMKAP